MPAFCTGFEQGICGICLFHVNCRGCDSLAWITSSAKRPLSAGWVCCKTIGRICVRARAHTHTKEEEETEESNQDKPINTEVLRLHIFHGTLEKK